jgi:hypothetical protein
MCVAVNDNLGRLLGSIGQTVSLSTIKDRSSISNHIIITNVRLIGTHTHSLSRSLALSLTACYDCRRTISTISSIGSVSCLQTVGGMLCRCLALNQALTCVWLIRHISELKELPHGTCFVTVQNNLGPAETSVSVLNFIMRMAGLANHPKSKEPVLGYVPSSSLAVVISH